MKNWVNGLPLISTEMYSMPCCTMRTWAARGTVSRMAHRTGFMATVQHTARRCGNPCNQYRDVVVGISVEQLHRFECRVVLGVLRFGKKSDLDRIGTYNLVGTYSGDTQFAASLAPAVNVSVTASPSAPASVPDSSSYVSGQTIHYTATVTAAGSGSGTPTGTVSVFDGSTVVCVVTLVAGTGIGTCTFSEPVGTYNLVGTYSGDTQFAGSIAAAVNVSVTASPSATALSASSETVGVAVTYTATVTAAGFGSGTPTGTVNFLDGTITIGNCSAQVLGGTPATTTCSFIYTNTTNNGDSITAV